MICKQLIKQVGYKKNKKKYKRPLSYHVNNQITISTKRKQIKKKFSGITQKKKGENVKSINKLKKDNPFKVIKSPNGYRVNKGINPLANEVRYLIGDNGQWHTTAKLARRKLMLAIDENNERKALKYLKFLNVVLDHQRTTNNANGLNRGPWKMVTMADVLENLDKLRKAVN